MVDFTGFHWVNSDGSRIGIDTEAGHAIALEPNDFIAPYGWTRFSNPGRLSHKGVWGELKYARTLETPAYSVSIQNRFCNRHCRYCSSHVGHARYTEPTVREPIPDAPSHMTDLTVVLSSGEPLMGGPFADAMVDWIDRHIDRIKKVQIVTALKFKTLATNKLFRRVAEIPGSEMGVTVNGYHGMENAHAKFGTEDYTDALRCTREAVEAGYNVRIMSLANATTIPSMEACLETGAQSVGLFTILRQNETKWPYAKPLDNAVIETAWGEHREFHTQLAFDWKQTPRIGGMIVNNCHQLINDLLGGRQISYPSQLDTTWPRAVGVKPWVPDGSTFCTSCDRRNSDVGCLDKISSPTGCEMVHGTECLRCPAYRGCFYKRSHSTCVNDRPIAACDTIRWDVAAALALRLKDLPIDTIQDILHGGRVNLTGLL